MLRQGSAYYEPLAKSTSLSVLVGRVLLENSDAYSFLSMVSFRVECRIQELLKWLYDPHGSKIFTIWPSIEKGSWLPICDPILLPFSIPQIVLSSDLSNLHSWRLQSLCVLTNTGLTSLMEGISFQTCKF